MSHPKCAKQHFWDIVLLTGETKVAVQPQDIRNLAIIEGTTDLRVYKDMSKGNVGAAVCDLKLRCD